MKHPYQGDLGGLPTPLTGIETPRVDIEDRGEQRHKPRYPGRSSNPFQYTDEAKQVPSSPKRENQPLEDTQKTAMSKPSLSKDTSSSSSSSDSDSNEPFDIRSLINRNKPTPSPRQPTSSPTSAYSPVKTEKQQSPLSGLGRPPKIISPVRDLSSPPHITDKSDTEKESRQKKRKDSGKVKPPKTHKTSKPSTDDEDLADKKRQRSPKKKPIKSSVSAEKSKKKSFMDDSDSEPEKPSSQSPAKYSAAQKLKKSSLPPQSTGGGGGLKRSSKSSSNLPSKSQPKHRKSEPVRQNLSDSEEEEEPVGPSDKKRKIFSNIFGISGGKGGKGKGKGGKGGITVTSKEESQGIDDDRSNITRPSPTQVKKEPVVPEKKGWSSDRENVSNWANLGGVVSGLKEDLTLSEDSMSSPGLSRQSSLVLRTDGRPSLMTSLSLSRLGRSLDKIQTKMKQKKKAGVKQECWITGGGKEPDLRKSRERTLSESDGECRKRREREGSPLYEVESSLKRLRPEGLGGYEAGPETPPPPDTSHHSWSGAGAGGSLLMPPPFPPKRVYYSYFERRQQDEAFDDDEENVVELAKRLKHEADQEQNMNTKCRKYLQVRRQILKSERSHYVLIKVKRP